MENNWLLLTQKFNNDLNEVLIQQHYAVQFIALAGKHLIPQEPDDSNTNMRFIIEKGMFEGNWITNNTKLGLRLKDLTLVIIDDHEKIKSEIILVGKSKSIVFNELKDALSSQKIDVSHLKNHLHYELPEHDLTNNGVFKLYAEKLITENINYRINAEIVLNKIISKHKNAALVRIWPHHFDTGSIIPIKYNDNGNVSASIGLGLAIPDSMVNEPYFYLSFWSEKPTSKLATLKPLETGEWMMPTWNGAVLKHSDILNADSADLQYEMVKSFFNSGIKILMDSFKI